ncbi:MAG: SpoIIE family protein phosphatase [Terracidiphilus sp.]
MHRAPVLIAAFIALCGHASALAVPPISAQAAPLTQWRSGFIQISDNWAEHDGDNMAWARQDFDASKWPSVDLDSIGAAQTGWHWFRKHVNLGPGHADAWLLFEGGDGTYEAYANGVRLPGASLHSSFNVYRPTERAFQLHSDNGDFTIALRTHAPANYIDYQLPLFLSATVGSEFAIDYERAALQANRLDGAWPSIAINLLLCLAGLTVLCLYLGQRAHRDYLFLGLYLFVLGLANGLWNLQQSGVAPTSLNFLGSDLLVYVYTILQIEFTFSFVGKNPGRAMRIYQVALLLPWIIAFLCWNGHFPSDTYALIEAAITIPAAFILTTLLLVWYRRGNREAGWLILPSLLPLTMNALFDLGFASILLGWGRFDFLDSLIPIGLLQLQPIDLANLLFLVAIAVVMFFRFMRVSREQAHAEAELDAARLVQRQLVQPAVNTPGFLVESAYLPAAQVGGDFFHVRVYKDQSLLIVVGDVSGKGLPAALSVSAIVGALRAMPEQSPTLMLQALNRGLSGNLQGGFVTCCALRIMPDGSVTFANAGHLSPYCNGREIELESGFPLGLDPAAEYPETHFRMNSGDKLTLLSDGVVEARNSTGELFGFERTAAISSKTADQIAKTAELFGQEDDITVLTLTRRAELP